MWESLQSEYKFSSASENSHWREALRVPRMPEDLQSELSPPPTSKCPLYGMICETGKPSEGKAEVRLSVLNLHLEFSDQMNGQNFPVLVLIFI